VADHLRPFGDDRAQGDEAGGDVGRFQLLHNNQPGRPSILGCMSIGV
jgi:hypothetical protein